MTTSESSAVAPEDDSPAAPFLQTIDQKDTELVGILNQMATRKPYHAVMRILLYVWPRQRREQIAKDLSILRNTRRRSVVEGGTDSTADSESSDAVSATAAALESASYTYTSLIWHNLNVEVYYSYINRHKAYVAKGYEYFDDIVKGSVKRRLFLEGLLLDEYEPRHDTTQHQIDVHDDSKYSFVETVTYAMKWYPCHGLGDCDEEAWNTGLQHHFCHNEHHPEYWGAQPMSWRHIVEAMYDMSAMELERQFKGQAPDNRARLLVFDIQYLKRFEATNQLTFLQKLAQYTMEAYCSQTGHPVPRPTSESVSAPVLPDKSQHC